MTPITRLRPRPPGQTSARHATVKAHPKLLGPRIEALGLDDDRRCLDQAEIRPALHGLDQVADRFTGHGAVGVEDQHMFVGRTKVPNPIGDVASLAFDVVGAAAVIGSAMRCQAEDLEAVPLLISDLIARRVGQDKDVKASLYAQGTQ